MIRAARRLALTWSLLAAAAFAAATAGLSPETGGSRVQWLRIRSANFELFTTAGEHAGRDLVRHFEQVRGFFLQIFGLQSAGGKPVRIIAFHSAREFDPYRPSEAATAFYHAGSEHDCIVMSSTDQEHYQVATHEYTHLLIGQLSGTVPLWLNEGLAELYSTLQQVGDRVEVGLPPPGRGRVLLEGPWIPLDAMLSTGHDSPLYNEKSRAGMFYSESWALVHMLSLDSKYRPHLADMLRALKTADSVAAFQQAYGESIEQVQADLLEYVRRETLHGVAFKVPLEKSVESPEIEPHSAMPARLALAELLVETPGKLGQAGEMYRQLAREFPQSWEVEAALGRFAWRERHNQDALTHFAHAAQLGATDARMFLDYASALAVTARQPEAFAALRHAIRLDPSLKEAHYDLGLALLRANAWRDAMAELQLARPLKPQQASRYFYGMAYSAFRLGDAIGARNYLEQGREYTKIPEEVSALNGLSEALGPPVVEGVLESIECQGKVARLHVRVKDSERIFLIPDLTSAKDLQCGPQTNIAVRIEFQAMPLGAEGADGIVRSLEFK
jgi:tetratricopeptide (TPR) repeat protein